MIYNEQYFKYYLKYKGTEEEKKLMKFRLHILKEAVKYIDGYRRIVDVGCAAGAFLSTINKDVFADDIIGVDVIPHAIAYCVKEGHKVFSPEMFDYFYKDHHINVMTFWDSMEHMEDPRKYLKKYNPDIICISMPSLDGFYDAFGKGEDIQLWKHWRPQEHLWNFDLCTLINFLDGIGYEVTTSTYEESEYRKDLVLGKKNIMTVIAKRK